MTSVDDLESAFRAAQAEVDAFVARVSAEYRERFPDSPDWHGQGPDPDAALQRARWSEEESTELERLRTAAREAALALHRARAAARAGDDAPD